MQLNTIGCAAKSIWQDLKLAWLDYWILVSWAKYEEVSLYYASTRVTAYVAECYQQHHQNKLVG